jgi:HEAT repeat protein
MSRRGADNPLRIRLSDERRAALRRALKDYNQGVRDAAAFVQSKLNDIDGEIYERETPD